MRKLSSVAVWVTALALLSAGVAISALPSSPPEVGEARSIELSGPSNSGVAPQGWGGQVIQSVDCENGILALVNETGARSNPRNPELWKVTIAADLKESIVIRESPRSPLTCEELKTYQVVTLAGEVIRTDWVGSKLVVSAHEVMVTRDHIFDSPLYRRTTIKVTGVKELGEGFFVTDEELKVDLLFPLVIERIEQGLWVQEPFDRLDGQLRPGMRVIIDLTTRPDITGVFTEHIGITVPRGRS